MDEQEVNGERVRGLSIKITAMDIGYYVAAASVLFLVFYTAPFWTGIAVFMIMAVGNWIATHQAFAEAKQIAIGIIQKHHEDAKRVLAEALNDVNELRKEMAKKHGSTAAE